MNTPLQRKGGFHKKAALRCSNPPPIQHASPASDVYHIHIEQCAVTGTTLSGHSQCRPGAIRACLYCQGDPLEVDADFIVDEWPHC